MECNIAERITQALDGKVDLYYGASEVDKAPYVVYKLDTSEAVCKDGPYKFVANATFLIVASSYAEGSILSAIIKTAIRGLKSSDLSVKMESDTEEPDDNEWIIQLKYTINQLI